MQSPCSSPASSSIFIKGTVPPMRTRSAMTYLPEGFRSASTGTRLPMRSKSSSVMSTPAACAIAGKCSVALVEPPRAISTVMAFSKASLVRMSRGLMPRLMRFSTAAPASKESRILSSETAACAELLGSESPSASIALAIVLAVYIPPQEPGPGIAQDSTVSSSASEYSPLACLPTASKTETISRSFFSPFSVAQPGKIVPP